MKPAYQLRNVEQVYNGRSVLRISEMDIQRGEVFACIGPSGAGKSTLLRLLALLEPPSAGSVRVNLKNEWITYASANTAARRGLAMVFQRPILLSRSVRANVAYGLRLRGGRVDMDRVIAALDRVKLGHLADAQPRTLSGGELQRVSIARALVLNPEVLILDEPTANLDPYNVRVIEDLLAEQHAVYGTTIILVTHNIFQARRLATRVALLVDAEPVEVGPTEQIFDSPTDSRTAAFMNGEMVY